MLWYRQALAACTGLLLTGSFVGIPQVALAAPPVAGLIVKFKDEPALEQASSASSVAVGKRSPDDRMRRALQGARLSEARLRPAGRAAQHLGFGRALTRADAETMAARLREQPEVEWVVPNERERRLAAPNDPLYAEQWWLQERGALPADAGLPDIASAWLTQPGRASVVIAVLDTGVTAHSELAGHLLPGYDFVSEVVYANDGNGRDADPSDPGDWVDDQDLSTSQFDGCEAQDSNWHGSAIAGMLAAGANNSIGVVGANLNGRVLPVRVAGKCGATVLDIVDGMRWAAGLAVEGVPRNANPARVINISFGGNAACNRAYQDAINELAAIGVVVVAAAGNEAGAVNRPASCDGVVGVAALRRDGLKAYYSNFGGQVVVSTVGGDPSTDDGLLTLWNEGTREPKGEGYAHVYGTSFASPIVAGIASLMLSANPDLTVAQVIDGLRTSARPHVTASGMPACSATQASDCACSTSTCGAGVADAAGAVQYALNPRVLPQASAPSTGGDSGGGALGWAWLLGLALAVVASAGLSSGPRARAQRKGLAL